MLTLKLNEDIVSLSNLKGAYVVLLSRAFLVIRDALVVLSSKNELIIKSLGKGIEPFPGQDNQVQAKFMSGRTVQITSELNQFKAGQLSTTFSAKLYGLPLTLKSAWIKVEEVRIDDKEYIGSLKELDPASILEVIPWKTNYYGPNLAKMTQKSIGSLTQNALFDRLIQSELKTAPGDQNHIYEGSFKHRLLRRITQENSIVMIRKGMIKNPTFLISRPETIKSGYVKNIVTIHGTSKTYLGSVVSKMLRGTKLITRATKIS